MIRKANLRDLDQILLIVKQAQTYLANNNIDQWQDGYPNINVIGQDIERNQGFVIEENYQIIGYFMLDKYEESYFDIDGNWLNDAPYIVIHRIAIADAYKSQGHASKVIDYVFDLLPNLRIDTHKDNIGMQNFLTKNGFQYCGIITLESGAKRLAYQKN